MHIKILSIQRHRSAVKLNSPKVPLSGLTFDSIEKDAWMHENLFKCKNSKMNFASSKKVNTHILYV